MSSAYCAQTDIEKVYGANNVSKWADIDLDADAGTKSDRITEAIDVASEEIDDALRLLGVRIPAATAAGATPTTVRHLAAVLAGLWLYEARGAEDYNRDGTIRHGHAWRREWADNYLNMIVTGKRKLDMATGN
jgi:hypothetical protein